MFIHSRGLCLRGGQQRSPVLALVVLMLVAGCATGTPMKGSAENGHRTSSHYAQSTDSATNGCLRNPACYSQTGDEAIIPWLSRTTSSVRTTTAVAMMLKDADIKLVERHLFQCAKEANETVNQEDKALKGQEPDREECKKVVHQEGNKEVTRAMELGSKKHALALDCARRAFAELFAQNVSVEPTYQQAHTTGQWRWLDPTLVAESLQLGLTSILWGALFPDIVLHASGDPDALLGGKLDPQSVTPKGVR